MGMDYQLLRIRLLRVAQYRCAIELHGVPCGEMASHIALIDGEGWRTSCGQHVSLGDGFV